MNPLNGHDYSVTWMSPGGLQKRCVISATRLYNERDTAIVDRIPTMLQEGMGRFGKEYRVWLTELLSAYEYRCDSIHVYVWTWILFKRR